MVNVPSREDHLIDDLHDIGINFHFLEVQDNDGISFSS